MKCLSVSQPFAELIISGLKRIDLRGWNTKYRGEILIHAPQKIMTAECQRFQISKPVTGAIVGRVSLVGVKRYHSISETSADFHLHLAQNGLERKKYGFLLEDPHRFTVPIPKRGQLGLFDVHPPSFTDDIITSDIIDEHHRHQHIGRH